ncbi:DUF2948 family protein [Pelagibius litoralis]|uniref:DUF2948 family protein n=1 Tax=Pelagibius litoralis TaxID=374515 RepID=A0A967F0J2_9PROT|nr:DUF2948 family protein [Pelagibius litoralis]NIA70839.1 DUF2948 family protein [Pelagibius litoralis]
MSESQPLKLRAHDPEDMDVVAALLQDALIPQADMAFLAKEKRFVMVANRFHWPKGLGDAEARSAPSQPAPEASPEGEDVSFDDSGDPPPFERVNSGICFDKVERVRYRGMSPGDKDEILSLLTITSEPRAITLLFSGDAAIRLEVEAVRCHLEDIGLPWPTRWRPEHGAEDTDAQSETGGE